MTKLLVVWLVGWAFFGFPWTTFTVRPGFGRVSLMPFRSTRRRDQVLNFVYYVLFGLIGGGMGYGPLVVTTFGALLSGTTEFVQIFSTDRFPSVADLLLNVAGTIVGISIAVAARSRRPAR